MLNSFYLKTLSATALSTAVLVGATAIPAHAAEMQKLVEGSNLIARTRVAAVEYKTGGPGGLPYTIVTFSVQGAARGSVGKSLTLRFLGGPDGQGHVTELSNSPVFQLGDQDILFVRNNGQTNACPLVDCVEGRFRVLDGKVYDGHGSPVQSIESGAVVSGGLPPKQFLTQTYPAPKFDDLLKNRDFRAMLAQKGLSIESARMQYQAKAQPIVMQTVLGDAAFDKGSDAETRFRAQASVTPVSATSFLGAVISTAANASKPQSAIASFDSAAPALQGSGVQPVPPAPAAAVTRVAPMSAADMAEEQRLPKDDVSRLPRKGQ